MNSKQLRKSAASLALTALAAAFLGMTTDASAQYTFTGGGTTTNWSDSSNWLLGAVPPSDGTATVTLTGLQTTSNVDSNWDVSNLTQALGSSYDITTSPGADLEVDSELDNLSTSALTISGTLFNNNQNGNYEGLTFNTGSYVVSGTAGSYVNVAVNPGASLILTSTGTISSSYGVLGVGFNGVTPDLTGGGTVGGSGTIQTSGGVILRAPDGDNGSIPGATLDVGNPAVNGGVGTLTINSPTLNLASGYNSLNFAFGGGGHSLLSLSGALDLGTGPGNAFDITSNDSSTAPGLYTLVSYTGSAIDPTVLADQTLVLPTGWEGSLVSSDDTVSLDLLSTGEAAVPEPQTWAFLGCGLVMLLLTLRRKAIAVQRA